MWKVLIIDSAGTREETVHESKQAAEAYVQSVTVPPIEVNPIFLRLEDSDGKRFYTFDMDARATYENDSEESTPFRKPSVSTHTNKSRHEPEPEPIFKSCPLEEFLKGRNSKK